MKISQPRFGDYPQMFEGLFREQDPEMTFTTYNVQHALPDNLECDAYLITGCKLSVYDDLPWIRELASFVRQAIEAKKKILAYALAISSSHTFLAVRWVRRPRAGGRCANERSRH